MISPAELAAAGGGLAFGLSLIVAVGAQNTYVLRQGLLREHIAAVVIICGASDVALIAAGVSGASVILDGRHWLLSAVRIVGAIFLFGFAVLGARRALHPTAPRSAVAPRPASRLAVVGACMGFTWLNPAVYLDTLFLLGSVANTRPGYQWWFGAGAMLGSIGWFCGLGFGARLLEPLFRRPRAWQIFDAFVGVVMVSTGFRVLLSG